MVGQTISHYEILEQLGSGGMGVVYKARDTKLHRDVALKFLTPELSRGAEANARFMQEAQAASALNHSNICVLHDIKETDDGRLYIVMPWYDGQTLKYRLTEGALAEKRATDVARQIADGLSAVHERGIVHRDIKPANIMVTDKGRVVILDFGRGAEVDHRTDLWSLGVVLYEMIAGTRPFEGDYEQALAYQIVHQQHAPAAGDPSLKTIIDALLQKDRDKRTSSAAGLSTQLGGKIGDRRTESSRSLPAVLAIAGTLAVIVLAVMAGLGVFSSGQEAIREDIAPDDASLAVLPFSNLKSDPETDFLGYALADQIIGSLTYVQNLRVRPASTIRQYHQAVRWEVVRLG